MWVGMMKEAELRQCSIVDPNRWSPGPVLTPRLCIRPSFVRQPSSRSTRTFVGTEMNTAYGWYLFIFNEGRSSWTIFSFGNRAKNCGVYTVPIEGYLHHPQPPCLNLNKALASIRLRPLQGKSKIDKPPQYGCQNDRLLTLIAAMYDKWGCNAI